MGARADVEVVGVVGWLVVMVVGSSRIASF